MHHFDKYSHIKYQTSSHLWWKRYPYKVALLNEEGTRHGDYWPMHVEVNYKTIEARLNKRERYIDDLAKFFPPQFYLLRASTINVFFLTETDALTFIDHVSERVCEVWRPGSMIQLAAMSEDHKIKVRERLFWDRYSWCIIFRRLRGDDEDRLFDWEEIYFGSDRINGHRDFGRSLFSVGSVNRLYLRDEKDVILTKLGISRFIARIEKAVLISDLENNGESDTHTKID